MRRMLDPKTIGGGEAKQLYRHHISLFYEDSTYSNYGYIYFDYDSTNEEQFTIDTLIIAMKGKAVICSGYLVISTKRIANSITSIDNQIQVKVYSIEESRPGVGNFNISKDKITIEDQVYQID